MLSTKQIQELQDTVKRDFQTAVKTPSDEASVRDIFISRTGMDAKMDRWTTFELDKQRFAEQKLEYAPSARRTISKGYEKTIYRKTISVTREASGEMEEALTAHGLREFAFDVADDLTGKIYLDMRNFLGYSAQGVSSYVDNGGFTIDTTSADGRPVFDTAHTLKYSTNTYSNVLSLNPALSIPALELLEDYMNYSVMDNYGQRRGDSMPNVIVTSRKAIMRSRVNLIQNSTSMNVIEGVANANSGMVNVGKRFNYRHIETSFDVDANNTTNSAISLYWFAGVIGKGELNSFQAYYASWKAPMITPKVTVEDTWVVTLTGRAQYAIGCSSPKLMCVSRATT